MHQADGRGHEPSRLAQMARHRLLAARHRKPLSQVGNGQIGPQVDVQHGLALRRDGVAQRRRQRVDRPALDARRGDDGLAAHPLAGERERDALERMALKSLAK